MGNKEMLDNFRVLMESAQNQRRHWSAMMTNIMGFFIALFGGIWIYFLFEYLKDAGARPSYLLIPSGISAIILGLWRAYARYLDNRIADTYPELIFYEASLSCPCNFGVTGYLNKNVPNIKPIIQGNFSPEKKANAISILAESKHIGERGNRTIEYICASFILITLIASLGSIWWIRDTLQSQFLILYIICLGLIVLGLIITLISIFSNQKDPSEKLVKEIIDGLNNEDSKELKQ